MKLQLGMACTASASSLEAALACLRRSITALQAAVASVTMSHVVLGYRTCSLPTRTGRHAVGLQTGNRSRLEQCRAATYNSRNSRL